MKKKLIALILVSAVFFSSWPVSVAHAQSPVPEGLYAPDAVMAEDTLPATSAEEQEPVPETATDELLVQTNSESTARALAKAYGGSLKSFSVHGYAIIQLSKGEAAPNTSNQLSPAMMGNYTIIPNVVCTPCDGPALPNDPELYRQYFHTLIGDYDAWSITKGSADVVVAVIDTGIDIDHIEFAGGISPLSYNAYTGTRVTADNYSAIQDDYGHGTHVAGIIAANQNNGAGGSGIAPDISLMVIKANPSNTGYFYNSTLIDAIYYAVDNGAKIINMSLGRSFDSGGNSLEHNAIQYAQEHGVLVVCAAGNERDDHAGYPAAYAECVAVSALTYDNSFEYQYSNHGPEVDLSAPGTSVYSTYDGGTYRSLSGTSMATPVVSGVAALTLSQFPMLTLSELKDKLYSTSVDEGAAGLDDYYGNGVINSINALSPQLYTVTFDSKDGSAVPPVKAAAGAPITEPSSPVKAGYSFGGWYRDDICAAPWNFSDDVTSDMTLYAAWTPGEYDTINTDGGVVINEYNGPGGEIVIPDTIDGKPVIAIGPGAFAYKLTLTGVTIPDSVQYIDDSAFLYCYILKNVTIGNGVSSIGDSAFDSCFDLEQVTFGSGLQSIGQMAFVDCESLLMLDIPDTVSSIGQSAFYGCTSLTNISLPMSLSDITDYMLCGCSSLQSVDIPNGVKTIGIKAIAQCTSLKSLVVPDSVREIKLLAFDRLTNLESATLGNGLQKLGDSAFQYCSSLTTVDLGSSVEILDEFAFSLCPSLTSLRIPDSIESIGYRAFQSCSGLQSLTFEGNAPTTGEELFFHCTSMAQVYYYDGKTGFGDTWYGYPTVKLNSGTKTTVTFDFNGAPGASSVVETVEMGAAITSPDIPIWEDHTFSAWYDNREGDGTPWNFTTDRVNRDITLYAKWLFDRCTVSFDSRGGSSVAPVAVMRNAKISAPAAPSRSGYTFGGWFKEVQCQNEWRFSRETVTGDITLFAKWTLNVYLVSFNSQGGSAVDNKQATYQTTVGKPSDPVRTGYAFGGWFKEPECIHEWNFGADSITGDLTLYAKWTENQPALIPVGITCQTTDATMYGANGTVTITATGGNSRTYLYSIDGGANWQSVSSFSAAAGTYIAAACDASNRGNLKTQTVTIGQPANIGNVSAAKIGAKASAGTAVTIIPPAAPKGFTTVSVTYTSTNPAVAAVDRNGNVTFLAGGKATIITIIKSQTTDSKGAIKTKTTTLKKTVTVQEPVSSINLNLTNATIARSQKVTLSASIAPGTASNKKLKWTSGSPKVATVSGTGVVTGKAGGTAIITCSAADGSGITASCTVSVTPVYPTGLKLSKAALTLKAGKTASLKATVAPKNTDNKTVSWTSSNPAVVTVDATGKIRAVAPGTAAICAVTNNGISASCTVTVQ